VFRDAGAIYYVTCDQGEGNFVDALIVGCISAAQCTESAPTLPDGAFRTAHAPYAGYGSGARGILSMQLERKRQALASQVAAIHWAVCALAILAAGLVQIPWDAVAGQPGVMAWSGRAILAAGAATAWLLATAWLHRELARFDTRRLVLTQHDSRLQLIGDSLLAGIAAAIIWRGHESPLAAVGAWSICPVVLVMGMLSAVVISLDRAVGNGGPARASSLVPPYRQWVVRGRVLLAGVLGVVLGAMSVWRAG
jgi:hypothetical protein